MSYQIIGNGRKSRTAYNIETLIDSESLRLANGTYHRFKSRNPKVIGDVTELLLCREHNKLGILNAVLDGEGLSFSDYGLTLINLANVFEVIYIKDGQAVWTSKKIEAKNA